MFFKKKKKPKQSLGLTILEAVLEIVEAVLDVFIDGI